MTAASVAFALVLASCGGGSDAPDAAPGDAAAEVTIEGIAYEPGDITIATGETVTWSNEDEVDHTVTSGLPGKQGIPGVNEGTEPRPDGSFDGVLPDAGATFSFTFTEAGTYRYYCEIHASMRGVVTVE